MNSLFSYFFTEFERVILGVFGTISGRFLEEKSRKTTRKKLEKNPENPIRYYKILFKLVLT